MGKLGGVEADFLGIRREQVVASVSEAGAVKEEVCGGAFPSALASRLCRSGIGYGHVKNPTIAAMALRAACSGIANKRQHTHIRREYSGK